MATRIDIDKVIKLVNERGMYKGMARVAATNFEFADCMALVEAIGKQRNPNFTIDAENRFAYENFVRWLHVDKSMQALSPEDRQIVAGDPTKGIYIAGNTGSGKSWCMEIMSIYANIFGFQIRFGNRESTIRWTTARAEEIVASYLATTSIDEFKKCDILCIQDFGAEPLEAVAMGNRQNVLRTLLEHRGDYCDRCLTLISSNYSLRNPALVESYGERVVSRLRQMCNYFEIKGRDRRRT